MTLTILSILLPFVGAGAVAAYAYRQMREAVWLKTVAQWTRRFLSPWTESREEQEKRRIKRSLAMLESLRAQMKSAADKFKNPDLLKQDINNQRGYEIQEYRVAFLEVADNLSEIAREIQRSVDHTVNSLNREYGKVGTKPETTTTARVETPTPSYTQSVHAPTSSYVPTPSVDDIYKAMNLHDDVIYAVRTAGGQRSNATGAMIRSEMARGSRINQDFFVDGPAANVGNPPNGYVSNGYR